MVWAVTIELSVKTPFAKKLEEFGNKGMVVEEEARKNVGATLNLSTYVVRGADSPPLRRLL
jgi:hypothetical protein